MPRLIRKPWPPDIVRGAIGQGVTIAVVDTGLDYTHADFGGPATDSAYQQAKDSPTLVAGTYDPPEVRWWLRPCW